MVEAVEVLLMPTSMRTKAEARKLLQRMLATLRADLRDVETFAAENKLEFDFMGMSFKLRSPYGGTRYAPKGIFVSVSEWESSSCETTPMMEAYDRWAEKYFPDED